MKNYFDFTLTGKRLFPAWLLFLLLIIAPYIILLFKIKEIQAEDPLILWLIPLIFIFFFIGMIISFFITKLHIEGMVYNEKGIEFRGSFGSYIGILLFGFFLSIITIGIYIPWFTRDLIRFFSENTYYDNKNFKFNGKGLDLFLIILLTLFIPLVVISIILTSYSTDLYGKLPLGLEIAQQIITAIISIPYAYLLYKWIVNIDYQGYKIRWETDLWESIRVIAIQVVLTIITVGIYFPLAYLKLFKYFSEKSVARSSDNNLRFGYDIEPIDDFLLIWGQMLLAIITLGFYAPWSITKILRRVIGKTYVCPLSQEPTENNTTNNN